MSTINVNKVEHKGYIIDTSKCIRKLSNLERIFLWGPNCNVSMITRIRGNVSKERLHRALNAVKQIHPLVGAKIVFDDDHNAWFSTYNVPQPRFKTVMRVSDSQWLEELQREIQIPFNLETGPMIRFVLVYSEDISDLVIICNHSICDGMSLAYLVRDLLINYINPEQEIKMLSPPNIMNFLPKGGFSLSSVLTWLVMHYANRKWKKNYHYFDHKDYTVLQTAYWKKNLFGTVLLELEAHETKVLSKRCKKNGVTIGSAVTTAFVAAHEDVIGPFIKSQKQISVPFDLRRRAITPIGDVFCLCVGAPRFSYTYNAKKSFWKNVSALHEEIHKRVNKLDSNGLDVPNFDPALIDALCSFAPLKKVIPEAYTQTENLSRFSKDTKSIAFSLASNSENMIPGTIPSNLGQINISEIYGDLKIDRMVFLPAVGDFVPLTLGGVSIGGRMVFSLNYPEPKNKNNPVTGEMIQIRNKALEYLGFPDKITKEAIA